MTEKDDKTNPTAPPSSPPLFTPSRTRVSSGNGVPLTCSPAQSVWTAPTGRRSTRSCSPDLPRLPPYLALQSASDPAESVQDNLSNDAATYYTASWGSPYQVTVRDRAQSRASSNRFRSFSQITHDLDSSSPGFYFGLDHLVPSRVPIPRFSSPSSAQRQRPRSIEQTPTAQGPRPQRQQIVRSHTEDWVRQYRTGRWRSERGNWLSDESVGSGSDLDDLKTPVPAARDAAPAVASRQTQDREASPTLERQPNQRLSGIGSKRIESSKRGHKTREENLTLRQEDFWDIVRIEKDTEANRMWSSRWTPKADGRRESWASASLDDGPVEFEKPLPRVPEKQVQTENTVDKNTHDASGSQLAPAEPALSVPTPRKKLLWRGKACWVALPPAESGENGWPEPLHPSEVEARLRSFEQAGYNVHGFDLDDEQRGTKGSSQNRPEYPDPAEDLVQREKKNFNVRVADPKTWKEYVNWLTEEKLRALGVSIGGDDAPPPIPRPASAGHRAFSPSMSISMPGLPSLAASQRTTPTLPRSPFGIPGHAHSASVIPPLSGPMIGHGHSASVISPLSGPMMGHAHSASVISPLSGPNDMRGHMSRHSVFGMPGMPYGFPQQQNAHSGLPVWPPSQHLNMNGMPRASSPQLAHLKTDGMRVMSPGSPLSLPPLQPSPNQGPGDWRSQAHQRQQSAYPTFPAQHVQNNISNRATPALAEVREDEEEEEAMKDYFAGVRPHQQQQEIAVPTPRGHRHNISETLEREIREAEYHLEKSIDRQLDEDDYEQQSNFEAQRSRTTSNAQSTSDVPEWRRGSRANTLQSNGTQQSVKPIGPGSTTQSPQLIQTPTITASATQQPPLPNKIHDRIKGHVSKLSVAAPEFKFGPSASLGAVSTPTLSQPQQAPQPFAPMSASVNRPAGHQREPSASLNVAAPAFNPTGFLGLSMPSSDFNFSSAHTFKPGVSAFEPAPSAPPAGQQSIFGPISIPDVVKPVKKSKAVAIIKPDSPINEAAEREDQDGRPIQSPERQKRTKFDKEDGDDVPLFAEPPVSPEKPAEPTTEANLSADVPSRAETPSRNAAVGMEVLEHVIAEEPPALTFVDDTEEMEQHPTATPAIEEKNKEQAKTDSDGNQLDQSSGTFAPSASRGHKSQSSLSALAKPFQSHPSMQLDSDRDQLTQSSEASAPLPARRGHKSQSSLSAFARPFQFNPSVHEVNYPPTATVQEASEEEKDEVERVKPDFSPSRLYSRESTTPLRVSEDGSYQTAPEPRKHLPYPDSEGLEFPTFAEPSFAEIDAVMQQLNGEDDEDGFNRREQYVPVGPASERSAMPEDTTSVNVRSNAPSPSPRKITTQRSFQNRSVSSFDNHLLNGRFDMPATAVHRLNKADDVPIEVWSDVPSDDETKLYERSTFFDSRIDQLVGNVVQEHLRPLNQTLQVIQKCMQGLTVPRPQQARRSSNAESDADDEDDLFESGRLNRPISRGKEKRTEYIKAAVVEAFALQQANNAPLSSSANIHSALVDMNTTIARIASANLDLDDIRAVVEDTMNRQAQAVIRAGPTNLNPEVEQQHKRHISELEGRLNETLAGALEEANQRRAIEEREMDAKRLLRLAEEELSLLRATTSDKDQKIHALQAERENLQSRLEIADTAQVGADKQVSDLEAENAALEATLEEYRVSSDKWRQEVDEGIADREVLRSTVHDLQGQIADGMNIKESMRGKLDKIHADMAAAAEQLASEKAAWQNRNEELQKRFAVLQARYDTETSERRRVENELQLMRVQVNDGVEAKLKLEHALQANALLESSVQNLTTELNTAQAAAARFEREFNDAKEVGRAEVHRNRVLMEADIEAANNQVKIIRASLENDIAMAKNELDNVRMAADHAKARHELLLEEEADLRRDAIRKVEESSAAAVREINSRHAADIEYLKSQHIREIANALEDKQRAESHLAERMALSDAKVEHYQDRVAHLEEKLEVAKSAAQAAVSAAQAAKVSTSSVPVPARNDEPEKISPQALRESILVLQEQLQERESRIERLQSQISSLDTTAPAKLKERDVEISWLRELLSVRSEDLSELIRNLEQPGYDRETVRETAIRIRANLQMEQQEKERLISAGSSLTGQALAGLTNFASPKAVQLAAAFGNWRSKGKSESNTTTAAAPTRTQRSAAGGIFAGLMTPPASNLRRTPSPQPEHSTQHQRPGSSYSAKMSSMQNTARKTARQHDEPRDDEPSTPMLFRGRSYDDDAKIGPDVDVDVDVDASIVGGMGVEDEEGDKADEAVATPVDQVPQRSLAAELDETA
ncbi:hypothetical protein H2203_002825 [Taxawa tesnikishii (nom. ined.)]|nr:hypothetical protein H2203_002825 [Dothideales sp. JES 119]